MKENNHAILDSTRGKCVKKREGGRWGLRNATEKLEKMGCEDKSLTLTIKRWLMALSGHRGQDTRQITEAKKLMKKVVWLLMMEMKFS